MIEWMGMSLIDWIQSILLMKWWMMKWNYREWNEWMMADDDDGGGDQVSQWMSESLNDRDWG